MVKSKSPAQIVGNVLTSVFLLAVFIVMAYPFLYVFFYLTLDFVYCGLLACICLAVSRWIKQKWVVVILPLFICLTLTYGQRFIYTSPLSVQYKQTSPLYFLHPVEIQYPASWFSYQLWLFSLLPC